MTDVSVEDIAEETDSPAETPATRPFPLNLSASLAAAPVVTEVPSAAAAVVKGRIRVADEVVEKVAALATLEVAGVVGLGEDPSGVLEAIGERVSTATATATAAGKRGRGVSAHVQDRTVAIDVSIVAEYGHVVMDVANEVKNNVARTVSRMLGMRVVEVNVGVEDVRLPGEPVPGRPAQDA
ncbi:Asp23/Gls24 family envelope stress response protein [Streptosporangium saharense]|uniref:Asp23/Gls24 family envelope stress response protein n=1 Tax=Streptosporangium saharense TaxID=1706840 RepID=UPI0036D0E795